MPEKKNTLPKVEEHKGFYTPYRPINVGLHFNTDRDTSEFATWKVDYKYDKDGNCTETIIMYED